MEEKKKEQETTADKQEKRDESVKEFGSGSPYSSDFHYW